ncbi:protein of unknown function [Microbacterium sp. Nx66]|nr:protein of unknown function [Microbacterium sp. Nx66]
MTAETPSSAGPAERLVANAARCRMQRLGSKNDPDPPEEDAHGPHR